MRLADLCPGCSWRLAYPSRERSGPKEVVPEDEGGHSIRRCTLPPMKRTGDLTRLSGGNFRVERESSGFLASDAVRRHRISTGKNLWDFRKMHPAKLTHFCPSASPGWATTGMFPEHLRLTGTFWQVHTVLVCSVRRSEAAGIWIL